MSIDYTLYSEGVRKIALFYLNNKHQLNLNKKHCIIDSMDSINKSLGFQDDFEELLFDIEGKQVYGT